MSVSYSRNVMKENINKASEEDPYSSRFSDNKVTLVTNIYQDINNTLF
jgi:hypothetical protein